MPRIGKAVVYFYPDSGPPLRVQLRHARFEVLGDAQFVQDNSNPDRKFPRRAHESMDVTGHIDFIDTIRSAGVEADPEPLPAPQDRQDAEAIIRSRTERFGPVKRKTREGIL